MVRVNEKEDIRKKYYLFHQGRNNIDIKIIRNHSWAV